jgi:hypothetical protein
VTTPAEQGALIDGLISLALMAESVAGRVPRLDYGRLTLAYPQCGPAALRGKLRPRQRAFELSREYIYLAPTPYEIAGRPGTQPVMTFSYDFTPRHPVVCLRIALFGVAPGKRGVTGALGFRFETPHREGPGQHNYHHMQLFTRRADARSERLPYAPKWIPESFPGFALRADTPATLLACSIISLYGRVAAADMVAQVGGDFGRKAAGAFEQLPA